ncbi:MAG: S41 family peptidase [Chitinophagaceae bacterium]
MRHLFLALLFINNFVASAQYKPNQVLNLGFEKTDKNGVVTGCNFSSGRDGYFSYRDDSIKIEGQHSIRLQKDTGAEKKGFGFITFSLPANFKGKEITLKGYIKTASVEEGYAGLWLRSDAGNEMVTLDNMNEKGVTGTKDWAQYSIRVPMDEHITSLIFGGLLTGKGESWFDKLELFVDDKPVESVAWLSEREKSGRQELVASGVMIDSVLNDVQQENLYVLGKVWGFLKYHHPEVAKGNYDFDSSLFSIIPAVLKANNRNEREETLLRWIATLGNEKNYSPAVVADTALFHTSPGLQWLNDEHLLSATLSAKLNDIYLYRNTGNNFYVRMMPGVGNPVFDKEAVYRFVPAKDDGFRMLALFRYWNMIEYFFPYKHLLKENWTDVLRAFIPEFAANRSPLNYRLACLRLINRVHDTHANIYGDALLQKHFGAKAPAVDFKMIGEKIVVTGFFNDSLAAFETIMPGDEITSVNGKKITDIKKSVLPYLCASNPSVADRNFIDRFLFHSNDDSLLVTYQREGKSKKAVLRLYAPGKVPYQNGDNWNMPMYKLLSPDIGYISLGNINVDSLPVIFKTFENTKGIVIDIRNYPSQFMPFAMGEYLKTASTAFVKFTTGDIKNPGSFSFGRALSNGPGKNSKAKQYKGYVVILVNEQSQSQAEYTTMALRTASRGLVMGSQTAGADGNISYVPFPGGFSSPFSGIGVFYPDGKETQGVGIVPDIVVMPSQQGIAAGKDEVLEKAIEHIRKTKAF